MVDALVKFSKKFSGVGLRTVFCRFYYQDFSKETDMSHVAMKIFADIILQKWWMRQQTHFVVVFLVNLSDNVENHVLQCLT
jgi:hypothetical protein